jgi:hypothetical protein
MSSASISLAEQIADPAARRPHLLAASRLVDQLEDLVRDVADDRVERDEGCAVAWRVWDARSREQRRTDLPAGRAPPRTRRAVPPPRRRDERHPRRGPRFSAEPCPTPKPPTPSPRRLPARRQEGPRHHNTRRAITGTWVSRRPPRHLCGTRQVDTESAGADAWEDQPRCATVRSSRRIRWKVFGLVRAHQCGPPDLRVRKTSRAVSHSQLAG